MKTDLWALALLTSFLVGSNGYRINEDCGEEREIVRGHIDSAFELAANALEELNKETIQPKIGSVFRHLFGRGTGERGAGKLIEGKLERLAEISALDAQVGEWDVEFYCNVERIEKLPDGTFRNKVEDYVYPEGEVTDEWNSCKELRSPTIMITTNIPGVRRSEIQICPWFLSKIREWKFKDWKGLYKDLNQERLGGVAKVAMPLVAKTVYAPIDRFSLFDKVVLHELTHTTKSGRTVDMGPKPYGWKNCKKLADIFKESNFELSKDPQQNADSVALFCSAVKLINRNVQISDTGKLDPPQSSKRRDVIMYSISWVA